ncbi:MAG: Lrp/AsnC ligand binding domain-containing protein [Candidatus Lokiarchaeota archaeon]|nr:Lrp/AsnC ligand binding domain-containing protein [Candidatus Lokiarchaeota archaeon]
MEQPNIKHDEDVVAFLLLLTSSDQTEQLIRELKEMREVLETYLIYGEWDILVKIKVNSLPELTRLVMRMRKIEGVNKTSTLITTQYLTNQ